MHPNTLYYGDCLEWMQKWDGRSVDMIYLDPPFNSKQDYNMLYSSEGGNTAQYRAFEDTWTWDEKAQERFSRIENAIKSPLHNVVTGLHRILGNSGMLAYLTYMGERLEHMKRLLKPGACIFLHCDPTASHYLKLVMDDVFGHENFLNEIIWSYRRWPAKQTNFQRMHDVIFRYVRGGAKYFGTSSMNR